MGSRLPDAQPFIAASAVQIQRIVRGIATRKRVAKALNKRNRQQQKKKKGKKNKGSNKSAKSGLGVDGLRNTDANL